jgi:hypothetical protein
MKKEELTQLGLSEEQANAVFAMAGRDVEKFKKQVTDLETERTDLQTRLTAANDAVAKFEGINPDELKGEVEKYKQQIVDAENKYQQQLLQRDQKSWIKSKMDEYGVESPYARKQLETEAMAEGSGLSWKDGAYFGFDDFMKAAKEKDNSLYQTAEEKEAAAQKAQQQQNAPKIVGRTGNTNPAGEKYVPPKIF